MVFQQKRNQALADSNSKSRKEFS